LHFFKLIVSSFNNTDYFCFLKNPTKKIIQFNKRKLMKLKLPALHTQILIALVFGAIFGTLFNVNENSVVISHIQNKLRVETSISDWTNLYLIKKNKTSNNLDTLQFVGNEKPKLISSFKSSKKDGSEISLVAEFKSSEENKLLSEKKVFREVKVIRNEKTPAIWIKWLGDIFIRLLNLVAVPLVLASLIAGAASLGDIKKFARIGTKTLTYFLSTTAFAVVIGLVLANIIRPGERMDENTKNNLLQTYAGDTQEKIGTELEFDAVNMIVEMVPKNPFAALSQGEMLQIVFFAIFFGMVLTFADKEKSKVMFVFFDSLSEIMIKMIDIIMKFAPIGVFALIAATVSEFGFNILETLLWYAVTVVLGLILQTVFVYAGLIKIFTKMSVRKFFKGLRPMQLVAFSTSSSAATLPVNMECCQENLGVSKSITSFVLPLGATVNMDGTALYQGVATVFIAQVYGMDLSLAQQITIVFMAVLASIGTAPVPGVGLIMLIIILKSVGVPEQGIALILGIDRILDMCRTITNVTGDAAGAVIVAHSEKELMEINE
jgi:Na+/H+-dicarboxylate symporter